MSERSDQKRPLPPAILADALQDRPDQPSDVTAQAFREAAARYTASDFRYAAQTYMADANLRTLLLAAAEQREQLEAMRQQNKRLLLAAAEQREQLEAMRQLNEADNRTQAAYHAQIATLTDEVDMVRRAYETVQDNEFAARSPSTHAQNLAQQVRTLTAELELQRKFTTSAEQSFLVMKAERDEARAKLIQVHAWMTSDDGLDRLIAIMKDTPAWRTER